jgi:hypothetical protein
MAIPSARAGLDAWLSDAEEGSRRAADTLHLSVELLRLLVRRCARKDMDDA